MATRTRPADLAAADARRLIDRALDEIETARLDLGMSHAVAAARAGVSRSAWGRLVRREIRHPSVELICRAARAVELKPSLGLYPTGERVRDRPQLGVIDRFAVYPAPPLTIDREVGLPIAGDPRAWDGRVHGNGVASFDAEARLGDIQAVSRRIALKQRDDPDAGVVILVLNDTAHNRAVLREHREALRAQFPLDGAAIAKALRSGRVPPLGGIILV